jgi:hypothetical protein
MLILKEYTKFNKIEYNISKGGKIKILKPINKLKTDQPIRFFNFEQYVYYRFYFILNKRNIG